MKTSGKNMENYDGINMIELIKWGLTSADKSSSSYFSGETLVS